jgi:hypothetical protein
MTRLTTALLITAMAGTASAGDIYNGFARGNPDLYPDSLSGGGTGYGVEASQRIGAQPGVGDVGMGSRSRGSDWVTYQQSEPFRHYHDWARGNGDLYPEGVAGTGERWGYLRTGMQPGVGDTGMGSRYYVNAAPLPEGKPFKPAIDTFGQ